MQDGGVRLAAAAFSISVLAGSAALGQPLPTTTLDCTDFKKQPDGNWMVVTEKPFQLGSTTVSINAGTVVKPGSVMLIGTDLYALLQEKCHQ